MDRAAFPFRRKTGATNLEFQHTSESSVLPRFSCSPLEFVELGVLRFNNRQIIAGRNDATVQNDQVGVPGRENDGLLRAATEGDAGEQDGGVIRNFTEDAIIHGSGSNSGYWIYRFYNTSDPQM